VARGSYSKGKDYFPSGGGRGGDGEASRGDRHIGVNAVGASTHTTHDARARGTRTLARTTAVCEPMPSPQP